MRNRLPFLALVLLLLALPARPEAGGIEPSAEEQHGIYTINRARSDPAAYGDEIGLDLSDVAARPPLAVSPGGRRTRCSITTTSPT